MVEFFVSWDQIQPIIYFVVILGAILVFFRWRWTYMQMMTKEQNKTHKRAKSIEGIIDQKLNDIPKQLTQVENELKHLKDTGANEKQMKSLNDKKRLLELGRDYGGIAAEIGTPVIKNIIKAMKGLG